MSSSIGSLPHVRGYSFWTIFSFHFFLLLSLSLISASWIGVNLSGLEEGSAIPGRPGFDYAVPTLAEYTYFHSKGLDLIRLPFKWERIQHAPMAPLNDTYLLLLQNQLAMAASWNMSILLDCHNYARGFGGVLNGTTGNLTSSDFADLWSKLASAVKGTPGLHGYDIMNEPNNMPSPTAWPSAAQAAVDAIRKVDTSTTIYVEGDHWSGADNWPTNNPLLNISDPVNNYVYSAHCYLDRDGSGTHFNWKAEEAAGVTVNIGPQRLASFVAWINKYNYRAHIGEMGAGNDDPGWFIALDNAVNVMEKNKFEFTYWSGGPWFSGSYPMDVDVGMVGGVPQDKRQMAVLTKYSGGPVPTVYFMSGPSRGPAKGESAPFFIDFRGYMISPIVFKCYDSENATQPFHTAACLVGFNCLTNFTYTATKVATFKIHCTNDAQLTDPPAFNYTTSTDLFLSAAANTSNILSLRHLYTSYAGPAVSLRRSSDNQTADFGFTDSGDLDVKSIAAWAGSSDLFINIWYDQGPNKHHAGNVTSDFSGAGNPPVGPADQPQLFLSGGGSKGDKARIHFNGMNRMDATSPVDGLTSQTLMLVMNPADKDANRLLAWNFVETINFPYNDSYQTSADTPDELSLNVSALEWHSYFGRWQGDSSTGKQTYKDGKLVATQETLSSSLTFRYRNTINLGWFRWYSPTFKGDVTEIIIFNGALDDGDLARFHESQTYWFEPEDRRADVKSKWSE